jgi:PAS domain S-box-containing protein
MTSSPGLGSNPHDAGRFLQTFVECVHDYALIMLDPQGTILSWNPGAQSIKGYTADEIVGRNFACLYPPDDIAAGKPQQQLRVAAAEGRFEETGLRVRKDGSRFHADVVIAAVHDAAGRQLGFGKIVRDITERIAMEAALRAHEVQLSSLVDTILDTIIEALITIDRKGIIRSYNKAGARLFGYTAAETIGRNISMLMPEPHSREHDSYIATYLRTGVKTILGIGRDVVGRRKDGSTFPMELAVGEAEHGTEHAFVGTMRDKTEQLGAESVREQLRHAIKMEAVGHLTGGIAHDFNNILGVIIGNLDLLLELCRGRPDINELARDALAAALHGSDLTQGLLAFARRQKLQPEVARLNDLVRDIVKLLSRTLGETIAIELALAPDVWMVDVDRAQLEAAIANLATNARDAMPDGGRLTVATRNGHIDAAYAATHPEVVAGDYSVIEVSDTGSGIPPDILAHIFEPLYTTKDQGKGSGLGLSMVFGFMKQSGGHVNVYSELGLGTTFRLYLPRAERTAVVANKPATRPPQAKGGETVLVVEDNARLRRVAVKQLADAKYRVLAVDNPREALHIIDGREPIDLLFTDIVMPGGMDGHDLARESVARRPGLKVLLTSGLPQLRFKGAGAAIADYRLLSKPYPKEELIRTVREVLDADAAADGS